MAGIKLNLRILSVTDKIAEGRQIVTPMTNNAGFANPNPPLSDVATAIDDLEQAFTLVQAARSEVTTKPLVRITLKQRQVPVNGTGSPRHEFSNKV
jgi:hypothetical protein